MKIYTKLIKSVTNQLDLLSNIEFKCTLPCRITFLLDFLSIACIHLVVLSIDPVLLTTPCPPYFVSVRLTHETLTMILIVFMF